METKNILIILLVSFLMLVLLGCVEEETDVFCPADVMECPDGTFVARNPANNCAFHNCPVVIENQQSQTGEQIVGSEYYDSEQDAFDALNQELDQMENLSMQELESILGE